MEANHNHTIKNIFLPYLQSKNSNRLPEAIPKILSLASVRC